MYVILSRACFSGKCEATWFAAVEDQKLALLQIKVYLGLEAPVFDDWVTTTDPCVNRWGSVECDYLNGNIIGLQLRRQFLPHVSAPYKTIPRCAHSTCT